MRRFAPLLIISLLIAAGLAVSVAPNPIDSFQGANEFQLWASGSVVDSDRDDTSVTVTIAPGETEPSAVRATLSFDTAYVTFVGCRTLDQWVACVESSPGTVLFEAVTDTSWSTPTDLFAIDFATRDVRMPTALDLTIDQGLDAATAVLSGNSLDAAIAPLQDGDVNCSAEVTITDALVIAQYAARNRQIAEGCPLAEPRSQIDVRAADVNQDGKTNVTDALLVAQCAALVNNDFCPG